MSPETFDFGNGPVPAHRHLNPDGTLGGWVAETAYAAPTAVVGADACVYDGAVVSGLARITGAAHVYGHASVSGTAHVSENATVSGTARVSENATVSGHAHIYKNARIHGYANVSANASISMDASVRGDDILTGKLGTYRWTIYRTVGGWTIQYGCERRPIEWWREQDLPALSCAHGEPPEHSRFTAFVLAQAEGLALLTNPPQIAPSPE